MVLLNTVWIDNKLYHNYYKPEETISEYARQNEYLSVKPLRKYRPYPQPDFAIEKESHWPYIVLAITFILILISFLVVLYKYHKFKQDLDVYNIDGANRASFWSRKSTIPPKRPPRSRKPSITAKMEQREVLST